MTNEGLPLAVDVAFQKAITPPNVNGPDMPLKLRIRAMERAIRGALTEEIMLEVLREAVSMKGVSLFTKSKWFDLVAKRMEWITAHPPNWQKVSLAEAFPGFTDDRPRLSAGEVTQQVTENRKEALASIEFDAEAEKYVNRCRACDGVGWFSDGQSPPEQVVCEKCLGTGKAS